MNREDQQWIPGLVVYPLTSSQQSDGKVVTATADHAVCKPTPSWQNQPKMAGEQLVK